MTTTGCSTTVNISPGVSVLSLFRHLNYRSWYALAEFVDNALQSYLDNIDVLQPPNSAPFTLRIDIEYDSSDEQRIVIRDNAAGISEADYDRAFKPAQPPPDRSGLCEFGVGMKSAACWFAREWSVRTKALGEDVERTITFDVDTIVRNCQEELTPMLTPAPRHLHYTEVTLLGLHAPLPSRTIGKIKDHLASMYRVFISNGALQLRFNQQSLSYDPPPVLSAPYYKTPTAEPILWRKPIDLSLAAGVRVRGFAALRETASTSRAGFALFRRGRLIQGSADESYRPETIFKKSNSYTYQRLFGELHLDGIEVTHTKDGFQWEDREEDFLLALRDILDTPPIRLLQQAEEYRVRPRATDLADAASKAADSTAQALQDHIPPVFGAQLAAPPDAQPPPTALPCAEMPAERVVDLELNRVQWRIVLQLTTDEAIGDWLSISDTPTFVDAPGGRLRELHARLSLVHPFMVRFAGADAERIEPILRVAVALALGETAAREAGARLAGTIRRNVNQLLRTGLSEP